MEALFYWNLRVFDMEALAFVSKHALCVCVCVTVTCELMYILRHVNPEAVDFGPPG